MKFFISKIFKSEETFFEGIHKHEKIRDKIKNIVVNSSILALAVVVNAFHIPIIFGGIELEKIEFGLILIFLLANKVKNKILFGVVIILPLIDQFIHAHHNPIISFLECFFGVFVTSLIIILKKIIVKNNENYRNNFAFFILCFVILVFLRIIFFYSFIKVFLIDNNQNTLNVLFFGNEKKNVINEFWYFLKNKTLWYTLFPIIIFKFLIIMSATILGQKWVKKLPI